MIVATACVVAGSKDSTIAVGTVGAVVGVTVANHVGTTGEIDHSVWFTGFVHGKKEFVVAEDKVTSSPFLYPQALLGEPSFPYDTRDGIVHDVRVGIHVAGSEGRQPTRCCAGRDGGG